MTEQEVVGATTASVEAVNKTKAIRQRIKENNNFVYSESISKLNPSLYLLSPIFLVIDVKTS